jgi:hypothetical protein
MSCTCPILEVVGRQGEPGGRRLRLLQCPACGRGFAVRIYDPPVAEARPLGQPKESHVC